MIRLGSLAGYLFEGPRLLGGWTPPAAAAVYVILYRPAPDTHPDRYAVSYVDHSDDLATARLPFGHPRAACWIKRAGSKWKLHIATFQAPGGTRAHREQIAKELIAVYRPSCNPQQYDKTWEAHWIGEYEARTTNPLTTPKDPD